MSRKFQKELEKYQAANRKTVEDWLKSCRSHKMPTSRRDFLTAGVQATIGTMAAPSIFSLIDRYNVAHAAECAAAGAVEMAAFIQINLRGGWGLAGNWAPFDAGDNKLENYDTLTRGQNPNIRTLFANNARFYDTAGSPDPNLGVKFVEGLLAEVGGTNILDNSVFVGVPCRSNDDTGNNRMDITALAIQAGAVGASLPNTGENNSPTGVNHRAVFNQNPPAPLIVDRFEDISGALGFAGALGQLNPNQQATLAKLSMDLSMEQSRRLASLSGGQNIVDLVECATGKNYENMSNGSTDAIDPRNDNNVAPIWDTNDRNELARAAMVFNSLQGTAGTVNLEIGGMDYHGNNKATEDRKDRDVGVLVGKILRTAQALQKKVFIPLISDGSVEANPGTPEGIDWDSDSGTRGCLAFIAYDPAGAPATNGSSIGAFTNGQVADRNFTTGDSPERATAAMLVNWARFSGNMNAALQVLPNNTFSQAQLDEILRIV